MHTSVLRFPEKKIFEQVKKKKMPICSQHRRRPLAPPEGSPSFWGMTEASRLRVYGTTVPRKTTPVQCRTFDHHTIAALISRYYTKINEHNSSRHNNGRRVPERVFIQFRRLGPYMRHEYFAPYANTESIIAYLKHQNIQGF